MEGQDARAVADEAAVTKSTHDDETLKYHLLGPSLTKAGQDTVDQSKVSEIIYNASKGSKYFNNEKVKDHVLTAKIERILAKKRELDRLDLASERRRADEYLAALEMGRDLSQTIVHIDCDAFYAAVEELDRPELKDVPFAVGKGVLTTCNYHARKFGCRSGMAGFVAQKLCPQLVSIPLDFAKYGAKAQEVRAILANYDARFESASIDEAYLNITQYCVDNGLDAETAVQQLREEVARKTKITISAGIAANAKIAKIASNRNKPNGQFTVGRDRTVILAFMRDLPVRKVNGIGRVFERELSAIGIKTCGDIHDQRAYLHRLFGEKAYQFLLQCYLGLGRTCVQPAEEYERKSVGTESTFRDMADAQELRQKLRMTAEELERDLVRTQFKGRTLVLKIKLHTYEVYTRQVVLPRAMGGSEELFQYALPMLTKLQQELPSMKLRLMGLRCTHLVSTKKGGIDFFGGHRTKSILNQQAPRNATSEDAEGLWEAWPDAEFEQAARQEALDEMNETEQLSQEDAVVAETKHGREVRPNPPPKTSSEFQQVLWTCPICSRPLAAENRSFNEHVDLCLSRQTIRDAVQGATETVGDTAEALNDTPASVAPMAQSIRAKRKPTMSGVESQSQQRVKKSRPFFK